MRVNHDLVVYLSEQFRDTQNKAHLLRMAKNSPSLFSFIMKLSPRDRDMFLKECLLPMHSEVFIAARKGKNIDIELYAASKFLLEEACKLNSNCEVPKNEFYIWIKHNLRQTEFICRDESYDPECTLNDDIFLIINSAEVIYKDLFYDRIFFEEITEIKAIMEHIVCKRKCFESHELAIKLKIDIARARRLKKLTNVEISKLLQISVGSVSRLKTGIAMPSEINALHARVNHLTPRLRIPGVPESEIGRRDGLAAADDGLGKGFDPNKKSVNDEFSKLWEEYKKRLHNSRGGKK